MENIRKPEIDILYYEDRNLNFVKKMSDDTFIFRWTFKTFLDYGGFNLFLHRNLSNGRNDGKRVYDFYFVMQKMSIVVLALL